MVYKNAMKEVGAREKCENEKGAYGWMDGWIGVSRKLEDETKGYSCLL
jgi:hypothetical protein